MQSMLEGRSSDSPYIEMVWHGRVGRDYVAVCPADVRWNLLFAKRFDKPEVTVEGATTQSVTKTQPEGSEFLVIKFKLGIFMPYLPPSNLLNGDALLPEAGSSTSFWLNGSAWKYPTYENVETFVDRMAKEGLLVRDPVVNAVLQDQLPRDLSLRTVRRRFLRATGLTYNAIQQIERAKQAAELLEQGTSILDAVYQAGYADQPHLTRSMKRFIGHTPAQIARTNAG